ncbi:MarR family winged helix-turn-helix transcriptional regulator [Muricoccus vinaceus]|uniref:MarR family winged helix-turn-helix transcriptional regulator n=1 Tax=Muricoccus vinaceus TaxID=424704 RepID=A0ABV6IQ56_9PROT
MAATGAIAAPGAAAAPGADAAAGNAAPSALDAIYARPGFKLRRAHQIALSVFAEECRTFEITSTQYGILTALRGRPGLDQVGVAQALGLDRSTTGMVVGLLETRGLLRRSRHATDGRRRVLSLTEEGARLLEAIAPATERARRRLLAPLSPEEAGALSALLDRLLSHHDALVRVPLMRPED